MEAKKPTKYGTVGQKVSLARSLSKYSIFQIRLSKNTLGSTPGIEPGTTSTLRKYHTPRPSGLAVTL